MEVRVAHGPNSLPGTMFAPRMDGRGEMRFADFSNKEGNPRPTDVLHKPFVQPAYRTAKDFVRRQTISPDRHNGINRPEFTSLADVYEGALRNVLNIQLHLSLDDQQSFAQDAINDLLHEKSSPVHHPRVSREDLKTRPANHQYGRPREDNNNKETKNVGPFQGRTFLRDPRRVSPGGSAFHVPAKRPRLDEEMPYTRGGFPIDRFGVAPGPDFPLEYANSFPPQRGTPGMYRRRVNAPDTVTHVHGTNGMHIASPREHFSLWSLGHHRDIPALFPLRCASVERERRYQHGMLEEERRRHRDFSRFNGFQVNGKMAMPEKIRKEVKMEKPEQISPPRKEAGLDESAQSPDLSSPRSKPSAVPTSSPSINLTNGHRALHFQIETRYRSSLRRLEPKREGKKGKGEDGAQEDFLFQLGLERIAN